MRSFVLCLFLSALFLSGCENSHDAAARLSEDPYAKLKNTLCDKQIVIMGEGSSHDEGATVAFKSKLARDLIQDCGFSLMVFEASFYQFVNLNRQLSAGKPVSRDEIDASIGWLWRNQVDVEPLMTFLHEEANAGRVTIAGMDDQISGRGQDYANLELPIALTERLDTGRQTKCREALNKHIYHHYKEGDRFDTPKKAFILSCLQTSDDPGDWEDTQMAAMRASLIRDIQRDLMDRPARIIGRASSMFTNFEYWFDHYDKPKTIIWSATVHAAKSGAVTTSFGDAPNTGELINSRFGDDAYALGISALSGSRGRPGRAPKILPEAPGNAIEAMAFKDKEDDLVFVDSDALAAFGAAPAAGLGSQYTVKDWSALLDGLVVLRTQRPQTLMPTPNE